MKLKEQLKKNENGITAFLAVVLLAVFTGCVFDYYYDLNDDVLMKDILAGVYTGEPESRNIQMHWPISALISLLYRLVRPLPWYGLFLCFCHFGCFFLIEKRSMEICKTYRGKLILALTEGLLFTGLFLEHLVYAQYTVTCTLLAATAAFLFYTTNERVRSGEFNKRNIPAVLLVPVAYLIRSEMLLLVLPMICAAGVAKWGSEERIFTKENAVKYLSVIGLILSGILLGQAVHMLAYGSAQWRAFMEFFNNRTELYDFQEPPGYEEHRAFYQSIGLTESEKILLDNYNFGMDEEIDEQLIGAIAAYAGENKSVQEPFSRQLPQKLRFYIYRLTHGPGDTGSDYPWNYSVILGYLLVIFTALCGDGRGKKETVRKLLGTGWKLLILFAVRTGLWMFILMRGRDPIRITHSLYLMELCILAAMILAQWQKIGKDRTKQICSFTVLAGFGILAVLILPGSIREALVNQTQRDMVNQPYRELYSHLSGEENKENFYLIDVYSSVSYSEKMFEQVDNSLDNYDIMGGWACKSPLQRKKFALFGIETMEQALLARDNVYFVRNTGEDMEWLAEYYLGHGIQVELIKIETVADVFEIYQISAMSGV